MCTRLYLTGITNKDLPYSIENSAQFYVRVRMEGEFRGAWVRVCVVYVRVRMEGERRGAWVRVCVVLCESPDGRGIRGSMGTCVWFM